MKQLNKLSITMRLTLLSGALIFLTSLSVTLISQKNAHDQIVSPLMQSMIQSNQSEPFVMLDKTEVPPSTEFYESHVNLNLSSQAIAYTITSAKKEFDISSYYYLVWISFLGMIFAYLISKRALKPLIILNQYVREINEHNLEARIPEVPQKDEVASLSHSFNAMLENLQESFLRQKRFSANAAHELKTPLATMKASLQVLSLDEHPTLEDYQETTKIMQNNLNRLNQIVDHLFQLSMDNFVNESRKIDCSEMFQRILLELLPISQSMHLTITLHSHHEIMLGNPLMIERAFFNLIENAIKYNKPHGSVDIYIESIHQKLTFKIIDSGIGIENHEISKLCEPFYRVDPSRNQQIRGAGLGLSIVSMIFEKHAYQLQIESTPHVGTTILVLPVN